METRINTIQEITLESYAFGIYDYLFTERNMSRDEIFALFVEWADEFENKHRETDWASCFYYDEIDEFLKNAFEDIKIEDCLKKCPGISVGSLVSYYGGLFRVTGFRTYAIAVEEVSPIKGGLGIKEIPYCNKVTIVDGIMDTCNNHDPELVTKINKAWAERAEDFRSILIALYERDLDEILEADSFKWTEGKSRDEVYVELQTRWEDHAYNYLMHIADGWDLDTILKFLRVA